MEGREQREQQPHFHNVKWLLYCLLDWKTTTKDYMMMAVGMVVVKTPKNAFLLLESFLAILLWGYLDIMPCQQKKICCGMRRKNPMRYVYYMYVYLKLYTYTYDYIGVHGFGTIMQDNKSLSLLDSSHFLLQSQVTRMKIRRQGKKWRSETVKAL